METMQASLDQLVVAVLGKEDGEREPTIDVGSSNLGPIPPLGPGNVSHPSDTYNVSHQHQHEVIPIG